jgi:hypothetical protein
MAASMTMFHTAILANANVGAHFIQLLMALFFVFTVG